MSEENSFKTISGDETTVQIGDHKGIETPFFAPEIKNWQNDLHVTLDYREALDDHNPIIVPAWDWPRLREKNSILQRKGEDETPTGKKEVEELEKDHPLIHYFPPELLAYRGKTNILRKYLLKRDKESKSDFKSALQDGDPERAIEELPKLTRPFIRSNLNPILNDFNIRKETVSNTGEDPEEIWKSLPDTHYDGFYRQIANEAMERSSAVVVPPVPQIQRYDGDLITAVCKANAKMSKFARRDGESRAYFHLYLHYTSFSDSHGDERDTASRALKILRSEVERGDYAGIAVTIYKGEEVFESSTPPRVGTFFENLGSFAEEQALPVICPRSEWLGFWATDSGVDGFSSLYNGSWVYRSGGAVDDVDQYGYTMVPSESRSLKLRSDDGKGIEDHIADEGLSGLDALPDEPPKPPSDFDPNNGLQSRYGTPFYYRRQFGKPQKLNHIWEARQVRSGDSPTARGRLEDSQNGYVEFDEES
ncbi:hypothetical protein OB955_03795 [Halobacteria archaeon AArc-m2/3/4]|uniref:Uncharacterized protein n=1 Tax=Natronoglomus mannanivorans TaxID=2979990 RepID=A0ABT2QAB8_9EURY|nr:hypothetical protein [Halobacteria archaeon AArc-m2/3/4]